MPLEPLITKMLLRASSGVFVHWGAYESGKSTAVRHAMRELQLHRSVRLFHGYDIAHNENVSEWLRQRLGVLPTAKSITAAFPRLPGTLIIDHYDTLCRKGWQKCHFGSQHRRLGTSCPAGTRSTERSAYGRGRQSFIQ